MSKEFRRALVPISGDPVTDGHLDVIGHARSMADEVVVLIALNEAKKPVFSLEERAALASRAIVQRGWKSDVRVIGSDGLLVDVWLEQGCDVVVRGVRNDADRTYEKEQVEANALILPGMADRFRYVEAKPERAHLSSSLVKTFVSLNLDVHGLVPMFVKQALEERLLGQVRIGITGGIAVGKSHVAAGLVEHAKAMGLPATHVNVDVLLRALYEEDSAGAQAVRDALAARFGMYLLSSNRRDVDRKALAEKLFSSGSKPSDRKYVIDLTMPHVHRLYRKALKGARGLVVVEWAQMAEMDMSAWTNHNVIIVDSHDRTKFVAKRGLEPDRVAAMAGLQWDAARKRDILEGRSQAAGSGWVHLHHNRWHDDPDASETDLNKLFRMVRERLPALTKLGK